MEKRAMTPQESEDCLRALQGYDSGFNRGKDWEQCLSEGLKDEICECGKAFLACQHFVHCRLEGCPMRGKQTVLDMIFDGVKTGGKDGQT